MRVNPAVATGRVPLQAIVDDRAVLPADQFAGIRVEDVEPPVTELILLKALDLVKLRQVVIHGRCRRFAFESVI